MRTFFPTRFSIILRQTVLLLVILSLSVLSGCFGKQILDEGGGEITPVPQRKPVATKGTKPYTVMGQTYYPLLDSRGYSEEGVASWYGKDFHGKKNRQW